MVMFTMIFNHLFLTFSQVGEQCNQATFLCKNTALKGNIYTV